MRFKELFTTYITLGQTFDNTKNVDATLNPPGQIATLKIKLSAWSFVLLTSGSNTSDNIFFGKI